MSISKTYVEEVMDDLNIENRYEFVYNLINFLLCCEKDLAYVKPSFAKFYYKIFGGNRNLFNNTLTRMMGKYFDGDIDDNSVSPITNKQDLKTIVNFVNTLIYRQEIEDDSFNDVLNSLQNHQSLFTITQNQNEFTVNGIPFTESSDIQTFLYDLLLSTVIKLDLEDSYYL